MKKNTNIKNLTQFIKLLKQTQLDTYSFHVVVVRRYKKYDYFKNGYDHRFFKNLYQLEVYFGNTDNFLDNYFVDNYSVDFLDTEVTLFLKENKYVEV